MNISLKALALAGAANTRSKYRLVKIDYQPANGFANETNFFSTAPTRFFLIAITGKINAYS